MFLDITVALPSSEVLALVCCVVSSISSSREPHWLAVTFDPLERKVRFSWCGFLSVPFTLSDSTCNGMAFMNGEL